MVMEQTEEMKLLKPEEDRIPEILTAALEVFGARGVAAGGLEEIAERAGITLTALLRVFPTRAELFQAAFIQSATGHVQRACSELPPGTATEQLRNFCGRGWDVIRTPEFAVRHRLIVSDVPLYPDLAKWLADEVYGVVLDQLEAIIARGISSGEFRPVAPRAAARLIYASLLGQAFWCNHGEVFGPALAGNCSRTVAETLGLILGGLAMDRSSGKETER